MYRFSFCFLSCFSFVVNFSLVLFCKNKFSMFSMFNLFFFYYSFGMTTVTNVPNSYTIFAYKNIAMQWKSVWGKMTERDWEEILFSLKGNAQYFHTRKMRLYVFRQLIDRNTKSDTNLTCRQIAKWPFYQFPQ